MFTNSRRQEERTGKYGTARVEYLQVTPQYSIYLSVKMLYSKEERNWKTSYAVVKQTLLELVTQFQNASSEETKEKIVANLANFAYDPFNYTFLRQLNVIELFLDCITEPNERIVEFGIGGICNACADPANAALVTQSDGIPLVIQCLSSPVRNTVNYALGALYYLINASNKEDILKPEVIDAIKSYAAADGVSTSFSNLAQAILDKHVSELN